jgi:cysteine desulfurase
VRVDGIIYMDHHATTPVDPAVLAAMRPYLEERFGNAASKTHIFGWTAEEAAEKARAEVASLIGAEPAEIVFTSGATESDNMALKGIARASRDRGRHIVTAVTEHKAILDSAKALEEEGFEVTLLPVARDGLLDPGDVRRALRPDTTIVSIMMANGEIGVLQPIREIAAAAREAGALFHTDAVQAVGKVPVDVGELGVDLLSLSAHKMYGPKGVGALYVRRASPRIRMAPILSGGGQEGGYRAGTLNVPGIVGLGEACRLAGEVLPAEGARLLSLRERLRLGLLDRLDGVRVNGSLERRVPGNLNLSFEGIEGETLLMSLVGVALSSGSACTSKTVESSYVLRALGIPEGLAQTSLRFGLGRWNTEEDVDYVIAEVATKAAKLRGFGRRSAPAGGRRPAHRI